LFVRGWIAEALVKAAKPRTDNRAVFKPIVKNDTVYKYRTKKLLLKKKKRNVLPC
jgi:hypothetical protein